MLLAPSRPRRRSIPRTSSGLELPRGVDYRTIDGRRFRDLYAAYAAELGAPLSEPEKAIVRQAVALQMQAEAMQQQILQGESVDPDQLIRLSGTSKRLLSIIASRTGQRQAASGHDPLAAHIAAKYGNRPDASPEIDLEENEPEESDDAQEIEAAVE
jgi:hypothetical protein